MLRLALADEDHSVAVAAEGAQALDLLQHGHYRVLLLDLVLPRQVGLSILHALRAEPDCRALMGLLAAQGRNAEAVVLYRELEDLPRTTLGASPAPETQALAARLAEPAPDVEVAPETSQGWRTTRQPWLSPGEP